MLFEIAIEKKHKLKNFIGFLEETQKDYNNSYVYYDKNKKPSFIKIKYVNENGNKTFITKALEEIENGYKFADKSIFSKLEKVLYNLPLVLENKKIIITEGEKDADNLNKLNLEYIATTMYNTSAWNDSYTETLKGRNIIFIGDTGEHGEQFKQLCYNNLKGNVLSFKVVELKGLEKLGDNKDVTDWLESGHTKQELKEAILNASDFIEPVEPVQEKSNKKTKDKEKISGSTVKNKHEEINEGSRDETLFKVLCGMRKIFKSNYEAMLQYAIMYNNSYCKPPLESEQVEQKVKQAIGYNDEEFYYNKDEHITYKIIIKNKKDEFEKEFIPIYDGSLDVLGTAIDVDNKNNETVIVQSNTTKIAKIEIEKGTLFGNQSKFAETLNNKQYFKIRPNKYVQSEVQNYLYKIYDNLDKENKLETKYITNRLGFIEFQLGNKRINGFVYPRSEEALQENIYYKIDGIYNDIFKSKGTKEQWIENILKPSLASDNMKIFLLSTFGSLLIKPLNVHENFIVEINGNTGTSKTTALNVCASIFGKPKTYITDWRTTSTAVISKASELNVFPLMLDDTKKCDDKSIISSLVYALSGGKDKARSDITGKAKEVKTFGNITLGTGETSLIEHLKEGRGAHARFISLEGGALEKSNENKIIADKLNMNTNLYYGTIGFDFSKWLINYISNETNLNELLELYEIYINSLCSKVEHEIAKRRCNHLALLKVCGELLEKYFGEDLFNYEDLIDKLVVKVDKNSKEEDIILNAYEELIEYCYKNFAKFYTADIEYSNMFSIGQYDNKCFMFYDGKELETFLAEYGDVKDILRNFKDRGYLIAEKGRLKKTTRMFTTKKLLKMYVVTTDFYTKAIADDEKLRKEAEKIEQVQF